jgi:hypothetical protein
MQHNLTICSNKLLFTYLDIYALIGAHTRQYVLILI